MIATTVTAPFFTLHIDIILIVMHLSSMPMNYLTIQRFKGVPFILFHFIDLDTIFSIDRRFSLMASRHFRGNVGIIASLSPQCSSRHL
jgi:hypothetical protein